MPKTETLHVTGSTKDEINESFNAAMKHYTKPGDRRPTAAVTRRLREESKAAFEALDKKVPAGLQDAVVSEAAQKLEAELSSPAFAEALDKIDAELGDRPAHTDEVAAKRAQKAAAGAAKTAKAPAKAPAAPKAAAKAQPAAPAPEPEAPKNKGGRPPVAKYNYCPKCGYEFKHPRPECKVPTACAKRAAARTEPVPPPVAVTKETVRS